MEDVQDDLLMKGIELNQAEKKIEALEKENAELTRRWVEKMEQEARHMNDWNEMTSRDAGARKK